MAAKPVMDVLILLLAIPVVAIALLSILIYVAIFYLLTIFSKRKPVEEDNFFREEIPLLEHENLRIILVEDMEDEELTTANESWAASVYGRDTNLFRVKTEPLISGVHGSICCFFILEMNGSAVIQQLTGDCNTKLLSVDTETRLVTEIGPVGNFYLYRDEKVPGRIRGINYSEEITIDLKAD